jgi:beta-lactamase superfamily II metal-dependent hydrolase
MTEQFTINYYYMGQGDCILIVCPDGRLVMIDCGSAKGLGTNEDLLLKVCTDVRELTSKNHNKIDILILTHRDKDHYNQIVQIFSDRQVPQDDKTFKNIGKVNIDTVYFSSPPAPNADYALYGFNQAGCGSSITNANFQTGSISQVFINATEQRMITYTGSFKISKGKKTKINKKHILLQGTTPKRQEWSVSLIAGQVPESNESVKDITNALSLVTLLEIAQSKGLFLGDATRATEAFLMSNQKKLIKNVDFVHIPHHGSETSSGPKFVTVVNPKGAEVTHETDESGFKLPKGEVLERWLKGLEQKDDTLDHAIDYWERIPKAKFDATLKGWQNSKYSFAAVDRGYYLLRIPHNYKNRYIYIYQSTNQCWGLLRKETELNLWGTGATGFVRWSLPL